jgi:hypothetical protein
MTVARHERARSGFSDRRVLNRNIARHDLLREGQLLVTCWCESALVAVPDMDVRAGRTYSCGLVRCTPEVVAT